MRTLDIAPFILAQHGDLIVLNKPFDWPTTGRSLDDDDCVQYHLINHFGQMVWAVHQLDADTSGVCLFSLDKQLVTDLQALWRDPAMLKDYLCIVKGEPAWDIIDERSPIGKVDERSLGVTPIGKTAHTSFLVLDRRNGFSLIQAKLYTGRTHQIRIHLSHLGHPLIGEEWYTDLPCTVHLRQALHAARIQFPDAAPIPEKEFSAPLADDLQDLARRLDLQLP
ncbi:RluA family pseudouridine synthase [Pelagicoccus sp. SDUM812002]|uniref:RluA family pseudouridine synthase n=1 Tax=Pelagicoccus sp. SDUM812002 TaxID=3041266 RepID=UPI00280F81BC|nr:RluA family pseudouridine synthase [Pelagicoccus sp. SDUM812002]MDQ8185750.1 RluA family pseudouridine synthase [Pelagicoccus sp. SDUM812002]